MSTAMLNVREINFILRRVDKLNDLDLEYIHHRINGIVMQRGQEAALKDTDANEDPIYPEGSPSTTQ